MTTRRHKDRRLYLRINIKITLANRFISWFTYGLETGEDAWLALMYFV
jgi:hypothetical protein